MKVEKIKQPEPLQLDELDNGEFAKEDAEKIAKKTDKETEKELDKREKEVDKEITNAKTPNVKLKDGEGDAYKVDKQVNAPKLLPEGMQLTLDEDTINETIPRDLRKAYNQRDEAPGGWNSFIDNVGRNMGNLNGDYEEISKEEAKKLAKTDPTSLRLLIGGKLATLNDKGNMEKSFRASTGKVYKRDKWDRLIKDENGYAILDREIPDYVNKNGKVVTDTAYMPTSYAIDIADKIYKTDDLKRSQEVIDKRDARRDYRNELRQSTFSKDLIDYSRQRGSDSSSWTGINSKSIGELERMSGKDNPKANSQYGGYYLDPNFRKDAKAKARYYASEHKFRQVYQDFRDTQQHLRDLNNKLTRVQSNYDNAKAAVNSGSAEHKKQIQDNIARYEEELKNYFISIARLKAQLKYADEWGEDSLNELLGDLDLIKTNIDETQAKIDKMLGADRKKAAKESYTPSVNTEATWKKITEAKKEETFNDLLEELYPRGATNNMVENLLLCKSDMILEMLDLGEEEPNEE